MPAVGGVVAAEMEIAEHQVGDDGVVGDLDHLIGREGEIAARRQVDAGSGRRMPLVDADLRESLVDGGEVLDEFVDELVVGAGIARVVHEQAYLFAELAVPGAAAFGGDGRMGPEATLMRVFLDGLHGTVVRFTHRSTV